MAVTATRFDALKPVSLPGGGAGFWDVAYTLAVRQLRLRAKRTWFGLLWPVLAPVILLGLYTFVFQTVFKVPIRHYPVFLFAGLLPWSFLAQTIGGGLSVLSVESERIRNAAFPYELLPISYVLVMAIFFLATLALFLGYLAATGMLVYHLLPLVVVPVIALVAFVGGIAMTLSLVDVYNRDLRQLIGNLLTVWFFLVPIVYRQQMVPKPVRFLRSVDPMNMIVGQFRNLLYDGHLALPLHAAITFGVAIAFFLCSLALFRWWAPRLPKDV